MKTRRHSFEFGNQLSGEEGPRPEGTRESAQAGGPAPWTIDNDNHVTGPPFSRDLTTVQRNATSAEGGSGRYISEDSYPRRTELLRGLSPAAIQNCDSNCVCAGT